MPNALITGINGQDGAYLAHLLIQRGYRVWGAMRYESWNAATPSQALTALGIADQIALLPVDFESVPSLACAISAAQPDEIYNLAAQSSVANSFKEPTQTGEVTALGVARLLEAIRSIKPDAKFYQAGSSEMFGIARETPQTETNAVLSTFALRRRQALRALDDGEFARGLRCFRVQRHSIQSRIALAPRKVCDAQNLRGRGAH